MEYVSSFACNTPEKVGFYHQRLGALCTLSHFFGSTDLHSKNLIAFGAHPIIIDLETLLPVTLCGEGQGVRYSGLIPSKATTIGNSKIECSVLGMPFQRHQLVAQQRWQQLNTDYMHRNVMHHRWENPSSLPHFKHSVQSPQLFDRELIEGMTVMHRFISAHKEKMLAIAGPLSLFKNIGQRCLLRSSQHYANILDGLRGAKSQQDKAAFSSALHILDTSYTPQSGISKQAFQKLVTAEKKALRKGDIPYFSIKAYSTELQSEGLSINGVIKESTYKILRKNIRNAHHQDLQSIINVVITAISNIETN